MFYWISKIFWALAQPLMAFTLLFALSVLFYRYAWAKCLLRITAVLFVICGVLPIGPLIVRALEIRAEIPQKLPEHIDGIIVLGGAVNAESSHQRGQVQANEWSERIFEMMRLSRTYPQAKVIYSGGAGNWHGEKIEEAAIVQKLLKDMGFHTKNFIFENKSRTTFENVEVSRNLVHPQAGENWLLITSAFHVPRAAAVFKKQGWDVIAYPSGFIENGPIEAWQFLDVSGNYWKLNVATKEILGIIAYKLSERI